MAVVKIMGPPGTGKTYRLVNYYLKKELNDYTTDPEKIVYITFLNNNETSIPIMAAYNFGLYVIIIWLDF